MREKKQLRILSCLSDKIDVLQIRQMLDSAETECKIFESTPANFKSKVKSQQHDLVITDNYLWDFYNGSAIIEELNKENQIPVLIWSKEVNDQIMSIVFKFHNVYFLKKTEDEKIIIETILKVASMEVSSNV